MRKDPNLEPVETYRHDFISRDPNDTMQIGADQGSPVADEKISARFVSQVEAVRLYSGERNAKDFEQDVTKPMAR